MTQPSITLSQEQIDFYHREGYLALPAITSAEEVVRLQAIYDRLFTTKAGRAEGDHLDLVTSDDDEAAEQLPQILNPSKYAPELIDTLFRANAAAIARQLLGPEARFTGDHAIRKAPNSGVETPWHQDEAYWDPAFQYQNASVWMPLQEATVENGCLWFVPGSHEWPILEHRPIGGNVKVHGLELVDLDVVKDAVACPLPAGGITIHRNRTAHYAGANISAVPRRALILGAGLATRPYPASRSFPWNELKHTARDERARAVVD